MAHMWYIFGRNFSLRSKLKNPSTSLPASRACAAAKLDATVFRRNLVTVNWSSDFPTHLANPALYTFQRGVTV